YFRSHLRAILALTAAELSGSSSSVKRNRLGTRSHANDTLNEARRRRLSPDPPPLAGKMDARLLRYNLLAVLAAPSVLVRDILQRRKIRLARSPSRAQFCEMKVQPSSREAAPMAFSFDHQAANSGVMTCRRESSNK